jgi:hypothetical protein
LLHHHYSRIFLFPCHRTLPPPILWFFPWPKTSKRVTKFFFAMNTNIGMYFPKFCGIWTRKTSQWFEEASKSSTNLQIETYIPLTYRWCLTSIFYLKPLSPLQFWADVFQTSIYLKSNRNVVCLIIH